MTAIIPTVLSSLRSELRKRIGEIVNEELEKLKDDVETHNDFQNQKVEWRFVKQNCLQN